MPGRKKDEVIESFDYSEAHARLMETMSAFHLSRIDEMPRIELYRDQLLVLVSTELAPLYSADEKIITGSMVNNYVKQQVIPAPNRKRYSRRHLAYLLIVCTLKRVLPIAQVAQLIELCHSQHLNLAATYDELVAYFETGLRQRFARSEVARTNVLPLPTLVDEDGAVVEGMLPSLVQAAINLVIDKVYLERVLTLEDLRVRAQDASERD